MESGVSKEQFDNWLTPKRAVEILDSVFGHGSNSFISKHTLLERLRGGKIRAAAEESKRSDQINGEKLYEIPREDWHQVSETSIFWTAGDFTFRIADTSSRFHDVRHFDVRFDADAVRAIVAQQQPAEDPQSATEDAPKGPPVSEENLKAWYAVYRRAYQGSEDTLDNALKSARGMFPGKFVSRDRVRDLAGGRIRGRKPSGSAE
jgi:hypothetical protein